MKFQLTSGVDIVFVFFTEVVHDKSLPFKSDASWSIVSYNKQPVSKDKCPSIEAIVASFRLRDYSVT